MLKLTNALKGLSITLFVLSLTACGGGAGVDISDSAANDDPVAQSESCTTSDDENLSDGCGTLLVGVTDADGDFLNYTVTVTGLELTRADGTQVSVLPASQPVNFAEYVDVSELATAATVPVGIYTSGTITIDYSEADIQVEKDGEALPANMVDDEGNSLNSVTLAIELDEGNRLIVARRRPAMLEIDFNLAASHTVDLEANPITVTTEPFIVAEVDPVFAKEFRVRGPLLRVNETESFFRIAVRPFHRRDGRYGGVNVHSDDGTTYEIDGESFSGSDGLAQMATLGEGTPTITFGAFSRVDDQFTAKMVVAGSSVPGATRDAARGVIVARNGNRLIVRGASLIRRSADVTFDDQINVIIAETTKVSKNRRLNDSVTIADLSVGQAVTILGDIELQDGADIPVTLDASDGAIRMRITHASGHVNSEDGLILAMNLQALQGRRPGTYDFTGTGMDETFDATADNYEVSIEALTISNIETNDPVRVAGFISEFGTAPADFDALTVINYAESRSQIFVNWPTGDAVTAFSEITSESLTINTDNEGEGAVYKLIQGGIRTDLTSFDEAVKIVPLKERGFYTIKTADGIISFSNFADFTNILALKLNQGSSIDLMHAVGGFSTNNKTLSALKIAIKLN